MLERRTESGLGGADPESVVELQRVNEIRRDYVANVSHELKPPATTSLKLLTESLAEVDARSILMVVLSRLRPSARRKNIALSWKRSGKAGLYNVRGDETQLTSMFSNLVEKP